MRRILAALAVACLPVAIAAQVTGRNVNMVSGTTLPNGDPYLQRQNEPSIAVSTRNPLHLLAGSNDYRTVDLPGLPNSNETGDAWMGLFKSTDGGATWKTTLLPGYPQENPSSSPLKGYAAAADPVVRAGTNGLFYYSGIVFDRGTAQKSAMFVARFIDNNVDMTNPIAYVDTKLIATNPGTAFIDKPWIVVDVPRAGAEMCTFTSTLPGPNGTTRQVTQTFPGGAVYAAYSLITGAEPDVRSQIYLSRSTNCGATWSVPQQISSSLDPINQGAALAIDPRNGTLYIAWRRFSADGTDDTIMVTRSMDQGRKWDPPGRARRFPRGQKVGLQQTIHGKKFKKPIELADLTSLDQPTQPDRFRSNAYPTMVVDETGRVYVAWAERGFSPVNPHPDLGDARILIATSTNGAAWTEPQPIDNGMTAGHQLMPSLTYAGGKLMIAYYDLREDVSQVFGQWIDETSAILGSNPQKRHTVDIRAAEGTPGAEPAFRASVRVSEYLYGTRTKDAPGTDPYQLQYNPPNLKLFALGTVPFMGDYIDLTPSPAFVPTANGGWTFNTAAASSPLYHVVWTDNRDVIPPSDGNWANYVPPTQPGQDPTQARNSFYSPGTLIPPCTPDSKGNTRAGMRNQNIYTARITGGLIAGAPDNSKALDPNLQRTFVVYAQNTTNVVRSFRLTIDNQPAGGRASFSQFPVPPYDSTSAPPLVSIDVNVPARSTIARTVYATSTDPAAQVRVTIQEIATSGGTTVDGGLESVVILNPDISNPDISNPDISNPDISNPDISNPDISNPDISNPDISNPDISNPDISNPDISNVQVANPDISNPDISNPDISNPDISNPDISNPDISNPDISNPDISNQSLTDTTWTITNDGNTPTAYNVKLLLNGTEPSREDIVVQLILHKRYLTPSVVGCDLVHHTTNVLLANINHPDFSTLEEIQNPDISNPDISNATLWLAPGESAQITVRTLDVDIHDDVTFSAVEDLIPVVVPQPQDLRIIEGSILVLTRDSIYAPYLDVAFAQFDDAAFTNEPVGPIAVRVVDGTGAVLPGVNVTLNVHRLPDTTTIVRSFNAMSNATGVALFNIGEFADAATYQVAALATLTGYPNGSATRTISVTIPPPTIFVVTNTNNSGPGSLRQAMLDANARRPSNDVIQFNIAGTGDQVILPNPALPQIIDTVKIDGTSQPGYAGVPIIVLEGDASGGGSGLTINAPSSEIRALSITGFNTGIVVLKGGNNARIAQSYIGLRPNGSPGGNSTGIGIQDAANTVIGGGAVDRNVISNNGTAGIMVLGGANAAGTVIRGNYIGTSPDGLLDRGNTGPGISLSAPTFVGGSAAGEGNVISGNGAAGIAVFGGANTVNVQGNFIGTNATGTAAIPNDQQGIQITDADNSIIGGLAATERNVISGNGQAGIHLMGGANLTTIIGNLIGTNAAGDGLLGNGGAGIAIADSAQNIIGFTTAGARNVISGNAQHGISLQNAIGTAVRGNYIGTNAGGTAKLRNVGAGIWLGGTSNGNLLGAPNAGNVISGNTVFGIQIAAGDDNVIQGNFIGVDPTGTTILSNGTPTGFGSDISGAGVSIAGQRNGVGGDIANAGNVISGNNVGVSLQPGAGSNIIQGNLIGTDATGSVRLGNKFGIFNGNAPNTLIGGPSETARNVISGSSVEGIALTGEGGVNVVIQGNYIGTDSTGTTSMSNTLGGITVRFGARANIGGVTPESGNVISGNGGAGISLETTGNIVGRNLIGTDAPGLKPVPNGTGGIRITAAGNLIGGDTRRNTIAFNNGPGIAVSGSFSTAIRENAIFANAGLGIDLGDDGVTTNDGTDEADGIQNAPVLFLATTTAGGVRVQGSFSSTPGVGYDVVFYSSASCDPSGFGEGETPVGITLDNSTDLSGNMSIDINLGAVAVGRFITAVARDRDLNRSSEFSNCVEVTPFGIVEWTSFADGNGNYYEYVLDGGLSWDAARDAAAARTFKGIQGRLVSITTSSENFFVNRLRFFHNQQDMRAWVGLFDASGTGAYSWLGGEAMTYTNWSVGEPTTGGLERWVEMFADGTWNNNVQRDPIFPTFGYVVEYARAR